MTFREPAEITFCLFYTIKHPRAIRIRNNEPQKSGQDVKVRKHTEKT